MDIAAWRDAAYKNTFTTTVNFVENLKKNDHSFSIAELEAMLQSEYDRQGLAWDGRGEVVEINIEATIAAIQQELVKWRKEINLEIDSSKCCK
nr:hypothetical protein [Bacteroidota bacterium]